MFIAFSLLVFHVEEPCNWFYGFTYVSGADVNERDSSGKSALRLAAFSGSKQAVELVSNKRF